MIMIRNGFGFAASRRAAGVASDAEPASPIREERKIVEPAPRRAAQLSPSLDAEPPSEVSLRRPYAPPGPSSAYHEGNRRANGTSTETELILRHQQGDRGAIAYLLKMHAPFIEQQAKKSACKGHDLDLVDIVAEAQIGFVESVSNFEVSRGTKLITYAAHRIRHYVKRATYNTGIVRVSRNARKRGAPFGRFCAQYIGSQGDECDEESFDIADDRPLQDEMICIEQLKRLSVGALSRIYLTERERILVRERLIADEPRLLREIGNLLGISEMAACAIEHGVILKLRRYVRGKGAVSK